MVMSATEDQVIWQRYLKAKEKYVTRNSNCLVLRNYYDGIDVFRQSGYSAFLDSTQSAASSEELSSEQVAETGYYLIFNLLNSIVNKFIFQMAVVPEVQLAVIGDASLDEKFTADQYEKLLHGIFDLNQMPIVMSNFAWFYCLLGLGVLDPMPNKGDELIRISSLIPENFYPEVSDLDGRFIRAYFYDTPIHKAEAVALYPNHKELFGSGAAGGAFGFGVSQEAEANDNDMVIVVRFFDNDVQKIFYNGILLDTVKHGFGFIPLEWAQAIPRPGRLRGQSPIEQSIAIASLYSDMINYQADIIAYGSAPALDVFGTKKKPSEIQTGPGAVETWEEGAKVVVRQAPNMPTDLWKFTDSLKTTMLDQTGQKDLQFSKTGTKIDSSRVLAGLLGEFTQMIGYFQTIIGVKIAKASVNALHMIKKTRPGALSMAGQHKSSPYMLSMDGASIQSRVFATVKWPLASIDYATRVNIELQKLGAGVQSPYTTMQNLGISSPLDEAKEIIKWGQTMNLIKQGGTNVDMGQNRGDALSAGGVPESDGPNDGGRLAGIDPGGEDGRTREGAAPGGIVDQATQKGTFTPPDGAMRPEAAPDAILTSRELGKLLTEVPLKGRVYAMGDLKRKGRATKEIELGIEDMKDKATILNSAQFAEYKDRITFIKAKRRQRKTA